MTQYRLLVVDDGSDPLGRLLAQRDWVEPVVRSVSVAIDSLARPPYCMLLELTLPQCEREGFVRLVGDRTQTSSDSVQLALVNGMNPHSLPGDPIDFEEALQDACEVETV